jgi:hypothetical protein
MELAEAILLLDKLLKQNQESEWVEFKLNYHSAEEIGQRINPCAIDLKLKKKIIRLRPVSSEIRLTQI